jgi:hypothetical protein
MGRFRNVRHLDPQEYTCLPGAICFRGTYGTLGDAYGWLRSAASQRLVYVGDGRKVFERGYRKGAEDRRVEIEALDIG